MKNLSHIKCFVFDLDGTIYLGDSLFKGVSELLGILDAKGIAYYFLTNNSSRSGHSYVDKLHAFGLTQVERKQIITSGDIIIDYLRTQDAKKVFLVGTQDLEGQFIRAKFQLVNDKEKTPDFVVVGFDTTFTYEKAEKAIYYVRKGIPLVSTNEDILCPMPDGEYIPDCASITAIIEKATGVSTQYFGKPQKVAVEYLSKLTGAKPEEMAMVGDRLYTDIKMSEHGMETLLVLSGETNKEDAEKAAANTIICDSIEDLITSL